MQEPELLEIRAAIARLLPAGVVASAGRIADANAPLTATELTSAARMSPRRLQEFAAGRQHARSALEQLGLRSPELAVGPDRAPQWPEGFVGSISHAGHLVLAVAAQSTALRAIGVDLEPAVPLDADLLLRVCRPEELARLATSASPSRGAKLIFSAKESVYKCIAPQTGAFLEFEEVEILFEAGVPRFRVRCHGPAAALGGCSDLAGAFVEAGGYWVTAAWQMQAEGPPQESD
jgi:4'-phosphopantetheinyl transferase EntD